MTRCSCYKLNGQQCTRDSSNKNSENKNFCWQHQQCNLNVKIMSNKIPIKKKFRRNQN